MTNTAIELQGVTKRYGAAEVISDIDLAVPRGEIVVLIGPSGCGKTTTLRMMNRLVEPSSGRILVDGQDVTTMPPTALRRHIGYVIQQVGLFPHLRIGENVAAVLKLLRWPKQKIAHRVDEMLDLVGLDPAAFRDRYPKELSGGQKQRVGVARALAADPPILLIDEPFGAVDPVTRGRLQTELLRLQKEIRKTIVCVTHDIDEAVRLGDRIAVFGPRARIEQYDPPKDIVSSPNGEFVRDFLGSSSGLRALSLIAIGEVDAVPMDELVIEASRPIGWRTADSNELAPAPSLSLKENPTFADALDLAVRTGAPGVPITGTDGRYLGCVRLETLHTALSAPAAATR